MKTCLGLICWFYVVTIPFGIIWLFCHPASTGTIVMGLAGAVMWALLLWAAIKLTEPY